MTGVRSNMTNRTTGSSEGKAAPKVPVMPSRRLYDDVVILGFTDHRVMYKNHLGTAEIWGINELYRYEKDNLQHFTRWYEIHDRKVLEGDADHIQSLGQLPVPLYMQRAWDDIPPAVPFPKTEVEKAVGHKTGEMFYPGEYQTSSISWMISHAIMLGFKRIFIYGVDMAQETEYAEQRPACEYYIGMARGMGIEVFVPDTSDLLKAIGQYAFGETGHLFHSKLTERMTWLDREMGNIQNSLRDLDGQYQAKVDEFNTQKGKLDQQYSEKKNELLTNLRHMEGARQDCYYWKRSWGVTQAVGSEGPTPDRTKDERTGISTTPIEGGQKDAAPEQPTAQAAQG